MAIIIFILFSTFSFSSVAAIAPFTGVAWMCPHTGVTTSFFSTRQEACTAATNLCPQFAPDRQTTSEYLPNHYPSPGCAVVASDGSGIFGYLTLVNQNQSCPANSKLLDGSCICETGFLEEGNYCIPEPEKDPCELLEPACAGSQNHSVNFQLGGKKTGVSFVCMNPVAIGSDGSFPGCTRGCLGIVGGFTSAFQSDGGEWVTQGTAKFTGSTCDPSVINDLNSQADPEYEPEDEPNLTEKPDCPNGFKGTVNGVSVCVPPKASEGLLEKEEKDNGDGTKTEKETKVKCENGVCEITTTTITKDTTSNTVVSSSSATTTVEKGKFCADNPTASACKDDSNSEEGKKGSFSGSCQAGFECDGDAAMCAIAIEQHKRACETLEPAKEGIWKDIEAGTDSGSAEAMKREAQTINISTSLNTSGYGLPRSCPADPVIELPFVSKTFSIPFSKACPILKTMSDVALLITALGLLVWLVAPKGKAE